jgi:hypothetical protein
MNQYLFIEKYENPNQEVFIVEAPTPWDAYQIAAKNLYKSDEFFIEDFKDRCVNMSFAERFFMQTDEEVNHFGNTGEVLIDDTEFKKRVREYFGKHTKAAEDYLTYWFLDASEDEENMAFEHFINSNEAFLFEEWMKATDYMVLDIAEIKRLKN